VSVLDRMAELLGPPVPALNRGLGSMSYLIALPLGMSPTAPALVAARAYLTARGIRHTREGDNLIFEVSC